MNSENDIFNLNSSSWSEHVYIETVEHIIKGYVFMPKIGQKSRLISEILNSGKSFIAVTDCELEYKNKKNSNIEQHSFMAVNMSSVLIMRPYDEK